MRVIKLHYDVGERVGVHGQTEERLPGEDFYGVVRRVLLTEEGIEYNVEVDDIDTHGDLWWFIRTLPNEIARVQDQVFSRH